MKINNLFISMLIAGCLVSCSDQTELLKNDIVEVISPMYCVGLSKIDEPCFCRLGKNKFGKVEEVISKGGLFEDALIIPCDNSSNPCFPSKKEEFIRLIIGSNRNELGSFMFKVQKLQDVDERYKITYKMHLLSDSVDYRAIGTEVLGEYFRSTWEKFIRESKDQSFFTLPYLEKSEPYKTCDSWSLEIKADGLFNIVNRTGCDTSSNRKTFWIEQAAIKLTKELKKILPEINNAVGILNNIKKIKQ